MKRKKALLVVNPSSGKSQKEAEYWQIADRLFHSGYDVEVHITAQQGDAKARVAARGESQDVLLSFGGDGTYNETVSAVVEKGIRTPIYHLPHGTANDIARTLDLPRHGAESLPLLNSGQLRTCDAGIISGGSCFAYVAAFGSLAALSYDTPRALKRRHGYFAYLIEACKHVNTLEKYAAVVQCDTLEHRGNFLFGCVSNATSVGKIIRLPRDQVHLDDGKMEVLLVRYPETPADLAGLVMNLMLGRFDSKHFVLDRTARCEISLDEEAPWTLDGEELGLSKAVGIEVRPRAFTVYCGEKALPPKPAGATGQMDGVLVV